MEDVRIRRFISQDQSQVLALHRRALQAAGADAGDGPWDADLEDIEGVYLNGVGDFLLAIADEMIVGMGALRHTSPNRAEIRRMRVAPGLQRQGIGGMTLAALEERARALGCRVLHLDTGVGQPQAQRFYVKHGYQEVGRGREAGMDCGYFEKVLGR